MEYTLVSQINPTRRNWTIKVRVARMWKLSSTPKWKGVTAMELVLVDEEVCPLLHADICYFPLTVAVQSETLHQGMGITACIRHKYLSKFADSLVEGSSYMIKKSKLAGKQGSIALYRTHKQSILHHGLS